MKEYDIISAKRKVEICKRNLNHQDPGKKRKAQDWLRENEFILEKERLRRPKTVKTKIRNMLTAKSRNSN